MIGLNIDCLYRLLVVGVSAGLLFLAASVDAATVHHGKVVHISDGDTIAILVNGRQLKIRLAEIDTPEKGQPYGNKAKKAVADLAFKKMATVVEVAQDRYGRTVGKVYIGKVYVNAELVRLGYAWMYRKYAKDQDLYALEDAARSVRKGLWGSDGAIPPWEWRRQRYNVRARQKTPQAAAKGFACGGKRYCREMASCPEARFYLGQCDLSRLDWDKDGVPCEKVCL